MAGKDGIRVHVYGDYDNKQIDKAIRDLKTLQKNGEGVGSAMAVQGAKMQAFGAATAAMGAKLTKGLTLPIVGVATAAVIAGADFERSMNKVKAISGATGADFDQLKNQAKELGRTTGFSASQAAEAMSFLAMAGFKTTEILGAMPGTLNLAAAGNLDLARSADIASNILTGYGLEVSQLDHAVDVLAKTFTSSNTDLEQLGEAFKYAGPVAASAGVQFEEAAAAIGLMGNAGIQGSMAGTSLRGAISRLLSPTAQVSGALDKLGISVVDSSGALLPLEDIVRQLGASGATTGDFMQIFGQRAGPAMAALVRQGADALVGLTGELENSGGTAQKIADTQLEGFHGALIRLKSAFEAAMIAMAESGLLERATSLIEGLVDVVANLATFIDKLPKPIKDVSLVLGLVLAAAGPVLWIFGKLTGAIGLIMVKMAAANGSVVGFAARIRALGAVSTTSAAQVGTGFSAIGASAVLNMGIASRAVNVAIVSFKALVVAVKTFFVALGPVGIAIAAVTTAYMILSNRSAKTEERINSLTDAMKTQGEQGLAEVITAVTDALYAQQGAWFGLDKNAVQVMDRLGIAHEDFVQAVMDGTKAQEEFLARAREAGATGAAYATLQTTLREISADYGTAGKQASEYAQKTDTAGRAMAAAGVKANGLAGSIDGAGESFDEFGDEVSDATNEIKKLSDMFTTFDANVAAIRARDAFTEYMREFSKSLAKGNRDLLDNSKAAETNRDTIISAFEKKKAEILAWAEANGAGQDDVDRKWDKFTRNFKKRLTSEGFKAKDLEKFFGSDYLDVASVNVQAEMNRKLTSMALANEHQARISFNSVGRAIGQGASAGIKAYSETLWADVRAMMAGAKDAARNEAQISSPSKVFMEIGRDVVRGFVKGMSDSKESVCKAARESMIKSVKDAFKEGMDKLKARLDEARSYAMGWRNQMIGLLNMGTAFSVAQDKDKAEAEALKGLQDAEKTLSDARRSMDAAETDAARESARERVNAALEVMNQAQGAYQQAATAAAGSWVDEWKSKLTEASNFAGLLQQLKASGAHEMIVRQVAEAGPEAGSVMAHDMIMGGPAGTGGLIDQFNADFIHFDNQVTELGVEFANEWADAVGPKMGNLTAAKSLRAFRKEFGKDGPGRQRLLAIMDNLAASMSRTATITVHTNYTSSGSPGPSKIIAGATGGIVNRPTFALIGEAGPEAVIPLSRSRGNEPLPMVSRGGNGRASSTTINLTVNAGMGTQGAEVGRQIVDALKAYERRNGSVYVAA
jgi:TP901 family phage tail tape measure protein